MAPRISVVMPAYNAAEHVTAALESIENQVLLPSEVVVVDDGSTDSTVERVEEWRTRAKLNVRVLRKKNEGAASARNLGIRSSGGELIAFIDADDTIYPNHLHTLVQPFLRHSGVVLSFGVTEVWDANADRCISVFPGDRIRRLTEDLSASDCVILSGPIYESLVQGSYIGMSSCLIRRRAGDEIGWMDEQLYTSEDRDFFIRLSRYGGLAFCQQKVARKLEHETNTTHSRHSLRTSLGACKAVQKLVSNADALGLTAGERDKTRETLESAKLDVLYQASWKGVRAYRRHAREVNAAFRSFPLAYCRGYIRAVLVSLGMLPRAEQVSP